MAYPFFSTVDSTLFPNSFQRRALNGEIVDINCTVYYPNPVQAGFDHLFNYLGFASYEQFIDVCELRLDLDSNNSSSRFGPHYWEDPRCTFSYRIADEDVSIRSIIGAVDSATIKIRAQGSRPGVDRLFAPATDRLRVVAHGDTALSLLALATTTDEDFATYLSRIRLEVSGASIIEGQRIVETHLFADGIRSDQARSFVQVRPSFGSQAGQDAEVVACPTGTANLFEALGPTAETGGRWVPALSINSTWRGESHEYGRYGYITQFENRPSDTAIVTAVFPEPPTNFLSQYNDTISICPGDTLIWDLRHPRIGTVEWEDGTTKLRRIITGP